MPLFRKTKKEKQVIPCVCGGNCGEIDVKSANEKCCCGDEYLNGICCVKVLGAGCESCHNLFENAKQAVINKGLDIEVEYITDMQKIVAYGVMTVPALVVNEKVVSMGKLLKPANIEKYL